MIYVGDSGHLTFSRRVDFDPVDAEFGKGVFVFLWEFGSVS